VIEASIIPQGHFLIYILDLDNIIKLTFRRCFLRLLIAILMLIDQEM